MIYLSKMETMQVIFSALGQVTIGVLIYFLSSYGLKKLGLKKFNQGFYTGLVLMSYYWIIAMIIK
tara:strand:+ start:1067 stop:1261 length:195 start_codon:yes stop_codon:yes gene_type:complete